MRVKLSDRASGRRAQIIEATIRTLAEVGYDGTSFAAIVRRGGLSSTRMISYHFEDRAELMTQVALTVITDLGHAVAERVRAATTKTTAVRAYIEANLAHMADHRAEMVALTILLGAGALHVPAGSRPSGIEALQQIIDDGCRSGELYTSDPRVAATVIQQSIEAVPHLLRHEPDVDLVAYARDMTEFFETALRADRTDWREA